MNGNYDARKTFQISYSSEEKANNDLEADEFIKEANEDYLNQVSEEKEKLLNANFEVSKKVTNDGIFVHINWKVISKGFLLACILFFYHYL